MARAIFISYRRDDSEGEAGRLFDDLVRSFGGSSVFMDVSDIDPGTDFRTAIDANVAGCGVLLAIIGPRWATIPSSTGEPRLNNPDDFVRLEIGSALKRNVAVIPVLVHDAKMPRPDELPEALKDLAYRNSVEVTHARWNSDVQLLTNALQQYVQSTRATDTQPVHATVSVQLPPPHDARSSTVAPRSKMPLYAGSGVLAVAVLIAVLLFMRHGAPAASAPSGATASQMVGTWLKPQARNGNSLSRLIIAADGSGGLTMHAMGSCTEANCDWGTQPATESGSSATTHWTFNDPATNPHSSPRRALTIQATPDNGKLDLVVDDVYANGKMQTFRWQFTPGK